MTVMVKVCGFTRPVDVIAAVACGVDAFGFLILLKGRAKLPPERGAELVAMVPE